MSARSMQKAIKCDGLSGFRLGVVGAMAGSIIAGFGIFAAGGDVFKIVGGLVSVLLILLPWFFPELGLFVLGFAGRFEVPPLVSGRVDIAFWSGLGLGIVALLSFISHRATRRRISVFHPILISHVALFILVGILWVPMAGHQYADDKVFRVLAYGPALVTLPQFVFSDPRKVVRYLRVFVTFVSALAIISVVFSLSEGLGGLQRISPPGSGPITLARMTGFATIAALGLVFQGKQRSVYLSWALFLALVTFGTGSRGPALFLVVAVLVFLLGLAINRSTRRGARALFASALIGGSVLLLLGDMAIDRGAPFAQRYVLLLSDDRGASVNTRTGYIDTALKLHSGGDGLGFGTGSWPILTGVGDSVAYPHNIFAEYLVEQGVLGVAAFLLSIVVVLFSSVRIIVGTSDRRIAVLAVVGAASYSFALMNAQVSGDVYDNRYLWFFAGFLVACDRLHNSQSGSTGAVAPPPD